MKAGFINRTDAVLETPLADILTDLRSRLDRDDEIPEDIDGERGSSEEYGARGWPAGRHRRPISARMPRCSSGSGTTGC